MSSPGASPPGASGRFAGIVRDARVRLRGIKKPRRLGTGAGEITLIQAAV